MNDCGPIFPEQLRRRQVLALPWAALLSSSVWAKASEAPSSAQGGRFILVFLRGAVDSLSAFVPHADPHYRALRNRTFIGAPDGTADTSLKLDGTFGLHPALAPLWSLWQQGVLSFVPSVGLPQPNRSHFEAQRQWETGQPIALAASQGWLNTWGQLRSFDGHPIRLMGVGEISPAILKGTASVTLVSQGNSAVNPGALASDQVRQALLDLYSSDPYFGKMFVQGSASRLDIASKLSQIDVQPDQEMSSGIRNEMERANNGARDVTGLALDAQHLATLMNNDAQLRIGYLSAGGWDTHASQGNTKGALANSLGRLAQALLVLRRGFSRPDDVVVVASEFGRTCAENGSGGTDHGYGNAIWLMGDRVRGGRWHGQWEGLAPDQIYQNRDLPAFHDYRAVLSLILRLTQGANDAQLSAIFPGNPFAGADLFSGDNRSLSQLIRT